MRRILDAVGILDSNDDVHHAAALINLAFSSNESSEPFAWLAGEAGREPDPSGTDA